MTFLLKSLTYCLTIVLFLVNSVVADTQEQFSCASLFNQANQQYEMGHFTKALPLYQQVLETSLLSPCPNEVKALTLATMYELGTSYESQLQFAKAIAVYQTTLPFIEKIYGAEHKLLADFALKQLAHLYYLTADYTRAKQLWQRTLAIYKKEYGTEIHLDVVEILNNLAGVDVELAHYDSAKTQYQHIFAIYTQIGSLEPYYMASFFTNVAVVDEELGDYVSAEQGYKNALQILDTAYQLEHPDVVGLLNNLAGLYSTLGHYEEAELRYQKAFDICKKVCPSPHPDEAMTLKNWAELYHTLGHHKHAESLYQQALTIYQNIYPSEHPDIAATLNQQALFYQEQSDYVRAESLYQQARTIYENSYGSQHPIVAYVLENLANLYAILGERTQAKQLYDRSFDILEKFYTNHPKIAESLHNFGLFYYADDDNKNAEERFKQALKIHEKVYGKNEHPEMAKTLLALGSLYQEQEKYEEAKPLFQRALTILEKSKDVEHPDVVTPIAHLVLLSILQKQNDHAEMESLLQRALMIAIQSEQPELQSQVLILLSLLLIRQNSPSATIFFAKQSLNLLQNLRGKMIPLNRIFQQSFLRDKNRLYKYTARFLLELNRLPEALQILEMLKEKEYMDFLQHDMDTYIPTQASYTDLEQHWATRYLTMRQPLAILGQKKRELERKAKHNGLTQTEEKHFVQVEEDLAKAKQALINFVAQSKVAFKQADIKGVAKTPVQAVENLKALKNTLHQLGHGAVLVHYLMTEDKLHILFASPKADEALIYHKKSMTQKALTRKIRKFTRAVKLPDHYAKKTQNEKERLIQAFKQEAQAMYELLIKPIEAKLAHAKTLMVSLDGALRYLPIATLYDGEKYMAERFAIARYTQAAKKTLQRSPKQRTQWTVAGMGVDEKVHEDFKALKEAKNELENIVNRILPGDIYRNQEFTKKTLQKVLNKDYTVLHIASHFQFFASEPNLSSTDLQSFLLLGKNGETLSLAQIKEKYDFDDIELLTLSACDTAKFRQRNAREIEGLGTLLQNKGAKSVIATLWKVSDKATSQFMPQFYRLLIQNPTWSKAEALRQTQINFIKGQYAHPSYWAAFILMGNWL